MAGKSICPAVLIVALCGASGCMAIESDLLVGSTSQTIIAENAFSDNALGYNALGYNALGYNALSFATLDPDRYDLNTAAADDLYQHDLGRELLKYTTKCAYKSTDVLDVPAFSTLGAAAYSGNLGLAMTWKDGSLATSYRAIMSACLLAHLNIDGDSVPISVRYDGAPAPSQTEKDHYYFGDGVFYGDVYSSPRKKYACSIRQRPTTTPVASSVWDSERVCDEGNCSVTHTGYCDEVCSNIVADGNQWRFYNCDGDGTTYEHTFSVWLEGSDGPQCGPSETGFTCKP